MAQYSKRKDSNDPSDATSRPSKQTIQESDKTEEASQLTIVSTNAMDKNSANSASIKAHRTKAWLQQTINSQRRVTATPNKLYNTRTANTPIETAGELDLQQKVNAAIATPETMENSESVNDTTEQDEPPLPSSTHNEEPLDSDKGSASASAHDLAYFVEHLPRELLQAYEHEKFTKADVAYALTQARERIGDDDYNEFASCNTFNQYLFDVMHFDRAMAHSASTSIPPAPPSRAATTRNSPMRTRASDRKTGSPTPSNTSLSGTSDPNNDSVELWSDNDSGTTSTEKEEQKRKKKADKQKERRQRAAEKKRNKEIEIQKQHEKQHNESNFIEEERRKKSTSIATPKSPPRLSSTALATDDASMADDDATTDADNSSTLNTPTIKPPTTIDLVNTTGKSTSEMITNHRQANTTEANPYNKNRLAVFRYPCMPYMIRYETRIPLEESEKPNDECWLKLHTFLKTLFEADRTLVLYPWSDDENRGPPAKRHYKTISDPKKLPTNPQAWKIYFDRANPIKDGGNIYPSVMLGHSTDYKQLHSEVKWFLDADNYGWYVRKLQVAQTRLCGWFLYSLRTINVDTLEESLRVLTGKYFAIRWRTITVINSNQKSGKLPADQLIKALHVECSLDDYRTGKIALKKFYSSSSAWFPLGIKMRLIGQVSSIMGLPAKLKAQSFRLKQQQFYKHMKAMRSWEITGLDINPGQRHVTLRELLNTIESNREEGTQIFHSVDNSYQAGAVVFTFHPDREEEARTMVSSLVPFLKWAVLLGCEKKTNKEKQALLSRRVYKHFTDEALERSEGAVWNDATNSVDSPQDKEILDLENVDFEFNMDNYAVTVDTDDVTLASLDNKRMAIRPADVDVDDETQSTLASYASIVTQKIADAAKPSSPKIKQNKQQQKTETTIDNAEAILKKMLPHMRTLAIQAGTSSDAILLRQSLSSLDKAHPDLEATDLGTEG
jgi:hypothetical protein